MLNPLSGRPAIASPFVRKSSSLRAGRSQAFKPDQIPGLIGWFDAADLNTLTIEADGSVSRVDNKVPGLKPVEYLAGHAAAQKGPDYVASDSVTGMPGLRYFGATGSNRMLGLSDNGAPAEAEVSHLFLVARYGNGTEGVFQGYLPFVSPIAGYTSDASNWRCAGHRSRNHLFQGSSYFKTASINGAAFDATVLPLPLSVVHFDGATEPRGSIPVSIVGADRAYSWEGLICEVVAFSALVTLTAEQIVQVESYLTTKWGI